MRKSPDILVKYSEKSGISLNDIEERYDVLYKEFNNEKQALRRLKGDIQRESGSLRSSALMWKGFIFADAGVIDFIDLMKQKALKLYNNPETRQMAISKKIVTSDGMPLDTRKKANFTDNPNYMQELKGHSYSRRIYGIAGLGKDMETPKFFQMNFNDAMAQREDVTFDFYRMYMFRATKGQTDKNMYKMNAKGVTHFKEIEDISLEEKDNLIRDCQYRIWKVSDIEKAFAMNKDAKRDDRTDQSCAILMEGIVADIDYTPNERGNRRVDVNDDDMWDGSYTCWIPESIPLEIGKDSPVIIIGSIIKGSFNDKVQYSINADGIFPLPGYFPR